MRKIEDINELHTALLEMLCCFADYCREQGLTWYLGNGTLLGAVKYGDFIPWDDDADVMLPREDYDRLMRSFPDTGRYRLLSRERCPEWKLPYAKLSDERTVLKEGDADFGASVGIFLDIMPIDSWHPNARLAKLQAFTGDVLKRMLVCAMGGPFCSDKRGIRRFILWGIWKTARILGYDRVFSLVEKRLHKAKGRVSPWRGCLAWTCHSTREVLPKAVFTGGAEATLRGRAFPIPAGFDRYLTALYGGWRQELPPEKQKSNHLIEVWWKNEQA